MVPSEFDLTPPADVGLDPGRVNHLVEEVNRLVEVGELPSAQMAIARSGRLASFTCRGLVPLGAVSKAADHETLYTGFSTTKAIVSSAVWLLLHEGALRLTDRVVDLIPEFGTNSKQEVRVEHLLCHTAGLPRAHLDPLKWENHATRLATFRAWPLEWPPGMHFEYHTTSGMWVLAELIERVSGMDFRHFVHTRIAVPLGLTADLYLGLPPHLNSRVADIILVGEVPSPDEIAAVGLNIPREQLGDEESFLRYNCPEIRAVGSPSGGLITSAASLALFYQALLMDGRAIDGSQIWHPAMLREALRVHTGSLVDPITGRAANRGLGVVIAGDEDRGFRSFAPGNSPLSFGHPGAGGQIAWADPASGISFAFLTNGCEQNPLTMGMHGLVLSGQAASCAIRS